MKDAPALMMAMDDSLLEEDLTDADCLDLAEPEPFDEPGEEEEEGGDSPAVAQQGDGNSASVPAPSPIFDMSSTPTPAAMASTQPPPQPQPAGFAPASSYVMGQRLD